MPLTTSYAFKDTFFHRLDPRTKVGWLAAMLTLCFATNQWVLLVGLIVLIFGLSWTARLDLKCFLPIARVVGSLALGLILVQSVFYKGGDIFLHLGPVDFHVQGLWLAVRAALRLFCIILLFLQFLTWTHPTDLSLVLVRAKLPYRYALLLGLTLRFFPVLEQEMGSIVAVQEARGLELHNPLRRAFNLIPIGLPFCLRTLRRANEVALAMELRGYGFRDRRTFLRSIRFRPADYAITGGMMVVLIAYFILRAQYPDTV